MMIGFVAYYVASQTKPRYERREPGVVNRGQVVETLNGTYFCRELDVQLVRDGIMGDDLALPRTTSYCSVTITGPASTAARDLGRNMVLVRRDHVERCGLFFQEHNTFQDVFGTENHSGSNLQSLPRAGVLPGNFAHVGEVVEVDAVGNADAVAASDEEVRDDTGEPASLSGARVAANVAGIGGIPSPVHLPARDVVRGLAKSAVYV